MLRPVPAPHPHPPAWGGLPELTGASVAQGGEGGGGIDVDEILHIFANDELVSKAAQSHLYTPIRKDLEATEVGKGHLDPGGWPTPYEVPVPAAEEEREPCGAQAGAQGVDPSPSGWLAAPPCVQDCQVAVPPALGEAGVLPQPEAVPGPDAQGILPHGEGEDHKVVKRVASLSEQALERAAARGRTQKGTELWRDRSEKARGGKGLWQVRAEAIEASLQTSPDLHLTAFLASRKKKDAARKTVVGHFVLQHIFHVKTVRVVKKGQGFWLLEVVEGFEFVRALFELWGYEVEVDAEHPWLGLKDKAHWTKITTVSLKGDCGLQPAPLGEGGDKDGHRKGGAKPKWEKWVSSLFGCRYIKFDTSWMPTS